MVCRLRVPSEAAGPRPSSKCIPCIWRKRLGIWAVCGRGHAEGRVEGGTEIAQWIRGRDLGWSVPRWVVWAHEVGVLGRGRNWLVAEGGKGSNGRMDVPGTHHFRMDYPLGFTPETPGCRLSSG